MMRTSRFATYVLAACSVLLTLLVFEIGFRVKAWYDDRELDELGRLGTEPVVRDPNTKVRTKNIIRLSPNPRIIYELIPGLHAKYKGAVIQINADGFRGARLPRSRSLRSVRIAGIGDSVMFGYGVGEGEYYLHYLGEALNADHPQVTWEILNGGVPGYNTTMEVETLRDRLLAYQPDLVLIDYVGNDLYPPDFIRNPSPYGSISHSYLAEALYALRKGWKFTPDDRLASRHRDVPEAYQYMVGIEGYRRAMTELARIRDARELPVVVTCSMNLPDEVRAVIEELGFPNVESFGAMEAHLARRGQSMADFYGSDLTVSAEDPHPSPLGHRIIAGVLQDHLEQIGVIDRLIAQSGVPPDGSPP